MGTSKEKLEKAAKAFCDEMGLERQVYLKFLSNALVDVRKDMETLRMAISDGDLKVIHLISHRFKGMACNLRLNDIVPILTELNDLSLRGLKTEHYPSLFDQTGAALSTYIEAMAEIKEGR